ncbi:hypothetical protein BOTBODRAFT_379366 [Botryobasidium botryosum FD-172 SS1]|uniref:Uncharacterized protein n=1 Tax=Botryobasidium botryosum (strain FD-172 SS1) TaxID=930990 RepID=A0A067MVU5_BOTB1|nr:hypothetical protein BOTBODRAFT_379366 [Botryobasidium botryosum FD-172 SS1]
MWIVAHGSCSVRELQGLVPVTGALFPPYLPVLPAVSLRAACTFACCARGSLLHDLVMRFANPLGQGGWRLDADRGPWKLSVRAQRGTVLVVSHVSLYFSYPRGLTVQQIFLSMHTPVDAQPHPILPSTFSATAFRLFFVHMAAGFSITINMNPMP